MRLVKISAPAGKGKDVVKIAFDCGISSVSMQQAEEHRSGSRPKPKDIVDVQAATPDATALVARVLAAPFFDRSVWSVNVREPRSIFRKESAREITRPLPAPLLDIDQELWQFAQITPSFLIRVPIAGVLLAYGMIHDNPLFMIGGLIFLPFMTLLLGIAFGVFDRDWRLIAQCAAAAAAVALLVVAAAAAVAAASDPPLMFDKFPPVAAGVAFSFLIAVAAGLATADDAGHRQLIGLAAASQLALIPAWFGISFVFGFSESPTEKLAAFALNAAAMLAGSALVYALLRWRESRQAEAAR